MNHPQLADREHCTGCLACADSCSQKAITCITDEEGFYAYQVAEDKCVLCHRCESVCPIVSGMQYGINNLNESKPFAAWSTDESLRLRATSGGVFPAIAKAMIEQGGVVFGAEQERYYVLHHFVDSVDDIYRLQGSKYTQSKTEGVFIKVKNFLNDGRKVLFSGVGCQVAALLSFLKGNKSINNLITVDVICGGVPSSLLIDKYIENCSGKVTGIKSYRAKEKYILSVFDNQGNEQEISPEERALPLYGFTTGSAKRYICYDCPFAKGHRMGDITIGDYWGNTKYPEQRAKGSSVAIAHSEKGLQVLKNAELEIHEIRWRDFLFSNPRLVYGKARITKARKILGKAFETQSYEQLQENYANKGNWAKPITMTKRVRRFLLGKIDERNRRNEVERILKENRKL